jgi:hypothetical protein
MKPSSMMPPTGTDAARRLLILIYLQGHAHRLMMLWDFGFRVRESMERLMGQPSGWKSLGIRGARLTLRALWKWRYERWATRRSLIAAGLFGRFTPQERHFFNLRLTQGSPERATEFSWGKTACVSKLVLGPNIG